MLIVCPSCAASYRLGADAVPPQGRTVRCARCKTTWKAMPDDDATASIAVPPPGERDDSRPEIVDDAPPMRSTPDVAPAPAFASSAERFLDEVEEEAEGTAGAAAPNRRRSLTARLSGLAAGARAPLRMLSRRRAAETSDVARRSAGQLAGERDPRSRRRALAVVLVGAALGSLVYFREPIVAVVPDLATAYAAVGLEVNVRGLAFREVETNEVLENGVPMLLVSGTIENVTKRTVEVPRLRLAVRSDGGQELFVWTSVPSRSALASGEALKFQARLAAPPPEGREVAVRFLTRRDAIAGLN